MTIARRKATFLLPADALAALDDAVKRGAATSKSALVELALTKEPKQLRRQAERARWEDALVDPLFLRDLRDVETAFESADAETARVIQRGVPDHPTALPSSRAAAYTGSTGHAIYSKRKENAMSPSDNYFLGIRRPDGTFGARSLVAVIAAMDNANPTVRQIVSRVKGTVALTPSFGRGEVGADLEQHARTLANLGSHPNVAAAVVVSLESVSANRVAERIGRTGRPVHTIVFDQIVGTIKAPEDGIRVATRMVVDASHGQVHTRRRVGAERMEYASNWAA